MEHQKDRLTKSPDQMSPRTRAVLEERALRPEVLEPKFFTREEFATLKALAQILVPKKVPRVDVAGDIDTRLSSGAAGKGWRYDVQPPEPQMYRQALGLIDQLSHTLHTCSFATCDHETQTLVVRKLASLKEPVWMPRFWEDLLEDVTEIFYSHPDGQALIGATGMNDEPAAE